MAHNGNPETHRNAGYGIDTLKTLSISEMKLTSNQVELLRSLNKELNSKVMKIPFYRFYEDSLLENNKLSKEFSYAVIALLLSNYQKLKSTTDAMDRKRLYILLKMLDIPNKAFEFFVKSFHLQYLYEKDKEVERLYTSQAFNRYYKKITNYINPNFITLFTDYKNFYKDLLLAKTLNSTVPLWLNSEASDDTLSSITVIKNLNYTKDVEMAFQIYKEAGLFDLLKRGEYRQFVKKYKEVKDRLNKYSLNEKEGYTYNLPTIYFPYVLNYYNGKPLEDIPPSIVFLLSILSHTDISTNNGYYSLYNGSLPSLDKDIIDDEIFREYVKSILKGLDTSKSALELMLKIILNEIKFLSKPISDTQKIDVDFKLDKAWSLEVSQTKPSYSHYSDVFNQRIDYLTTLLFEYPYGIIKRFIKEILFSSENTNLIKSQKELFALKWLTYINHFFI